jgi:hypothetical protein
MARQIEELLLLTCLGGFLAGITYAVTYAVTLPLKSEARFKLLGSPDRHVRILCNIHPARWRSAEIGNPCPVRQRRLVR